ncbi:MAG: methylenetetrahydrofolate--tRNA-(uracil(54)-C(5))-methyltransferase (FADH(2)-oxidizing) TrmFO [Pseudomonadota bacterium]
MTSERVTVIGGGLAGCEAALRLVRNGLAVDLYEMKPVRFSPAHKSPALAELVCSNSFRSADAHSAVGLLKNEMRRLGSLVMRAAGKTSVPAGKALAVDRDRFSALVTDMVAGLPGLNLIRAEVTALDPDRVTVVAAGPLASEALAGELARLVGADHLYFYDAIAPVVEADSIDLGRAFFASRYDETGEGDYLNCPFTEEEYTVFYQALTAGEKTPLREFEKPKFFEGCLPIEEMAARGFLTLAFGPMKPVGLIDPRTGERPFAVVQLRKENEAGTLYNLVGFQTRLKRPDQDRVFRLIPGLADARFARWGSVHRNTFIKSPDHLNEFLQLRNAPRLFLAGQISGVEGYVESSAMGILAGENAARLALGRPLVVPPPETALGALVKHLTDATPKHFQPSNVTFGLTPPAPGKMRKKDRPAFYVRRAEAALDGWLTEVGYEV